MAAQYHVRVGGKVHGPFSGSQLKRLVEKGQLTEEAQIRPAGGDKWFPATKVAGLFDNAPSRSGGTSSSGSVKRRAGSSGVGKRPVKKKPVVDASDVFDLDTEGDAEFDDVEFDDGYDEPEFVDDRDDYYEDEYEDPYEDEYDDRPRRSSRRSRRGGGGRSRRGGGGTSWNQVRIGLLLIGIGICILAGTFAMQALSETITWLTFASGKFPGRSVGKMIEVLLKGTIFIAPLGNITLIVGCSLCVFAPTTNGAKGLAIAALATFGVHTITHFIYLVAPAMDRGGFGGFGGSRFGGGPGIGMTDEIDFVATWFPLFAGLILTSIFLWALLNIQKDYSYASSALNNIWFLGIFVGLYILGWIISQVWEGPNVRSQTTAKALMWLFVLLRLGHLSLYGVYIGRLIPQIFATRSGV